MIILINRIANMEEPPENIKCTDMATYYSGKENLSKIETELKGFNQLSEEQIIAAAGNRLLWEQAYENQNNEIYMFENKYLNYDESIFLNNVKYLCKQNKYKISMLEYCIDVSQGYFSRSNGKKRLSIDNVWKVAKILGVSIDDLVGFDLANENETLKKTRMFIDRIRKYTERGMIHWRKEVIDTRKPLDVNAFLTRDNVYCPNESLPDYEYEISGDIYVATIEEKEIYIIPIGNDDDKNAGYDFCSLEEQFIQEDRITNLLIRTCDDQSGYLKIVSEVLYNSIKSHVSDFVVSKSTNSLMDRFLSNHDDI